MVADGAYAKRPFLKPAIAAAAVIVSRPRKDVALEKTDSFRTHVGGAPLIETKLMADGSFKALTDLNGDSCFNPG